MKKQLLSLTVVFMLLANGINAQNIFPATGSTGIGTPTPNASAILEIKSTTKGMLAPRMTKALRDAIAAPATGLLIYQTNNTPGFYYYSGAAWTAVSPAGANASLSNLSSPTKVNVNLLPDSNQLRNLGSITRAWKNFYFDGTVYSQGHKFISNDGALLSCVFMGDMAGNANATFGNAGFGAQALLNNTTGFGNSGLGSQPLYSNTTGSENTATGYLTLFLNTTGGQNAAGGAYALEYNTIGSYNSAFGVNALLNNTTGLENTAVGNSTLALNTTGGVNTAVGYQALDSSTTGYGNVAMGSGALTHITSGNYNTGVGTNAGQTNGVVDNNIVIGYQPANFLGTSNTVLIGNSSTTFMVAQVGWSQFSDGRVKDNIKQDVPGLAFINKLKPVTYNFNIHRENELMNKGKHDATNWTGKYDLEKRKMTGFIAQDVAKAAGDINYDFSGVQKPKSPDELFTLNYSDFVVPLVKAVQELSKMNSDKDAKINDLETRLAKLEAMVNMQPSAMNNKQQPINLTGVSLEQNTPNPFENTTTIHYALPQTYTSAKIIITDKTGKVLKQVSLSGNGKGAVNIDAATLSSGAYNYALYVDGKLIGSKQMILTK